MILATNESKAMPGMSEHYISAVNGRLATRGSSIGATTGRMKRTRKEFKAESIRRLHNRASTGKIDLRTIARVNVAATEQL